MGKKMGFDHMKLIRKYAGGHKNLITLGRLIAAISAIVVLIPYYDLWKIIRIAVKGEDTSRISHYAWQAVLLTVASLLIYIAALLCTHIAAFRVQANMRSSLMKRIITLPLGVFDEDGTGKIRRVVNDSTAATETFIAHQLPDKAVAAVTPIGLLVLIFAFNWKIGLICLIPAVIGFCVIMSMMGKDMQEKMKQYQNALDTMSSEATEYVRGIPVVKTFGQTIHSFKRFKNAIQSYGKWTTDYTIMLRIPMTAFLTCINSIFVFIVIAAFAFSKDGVTSGLILNIMYYIIITPLITVALTKVAYSGEAEMTLIDALMRVESIMEIQPLPESSSGKMPKDHSVELKNVTYRYKDATRDAVKNVSLKIGSGEHIALVGPSGSGKTTLAELIVRFFDVSEGEILVGGVNVKEIPSSELMKMVSFVFQDSRLIKKSIFENVRMAKPDATEEEVMDALKKAQCMDIIEKLPNGIHTVIGEKGTYLSGGEQQRITIARAVLKNAPILILDEATAFADPDNESKVQAAFEEMSKGKTIIMIAHRLSTVMNADRIVVFDDGRCVENGKHGELMQKNGLYKRMFDEYSRSISWKVGA
ncbi:ATP-binding cassette, subfamily B [Eubacterium ruminantium]|uniref:ATP-binding cassette, subfamily B n=1 Tax=Eubacterium ruminantium TaxID=42322 RepID=A0A1T4KNQ6_9FIRM|nr:ABC transporter ATP-binding protein [Eubacterium ruminantium]SCW33565.1 ATP-binding cassette, subfamily B [Eubacterium ruminantium]SDM31151.1 ATP-binding cassette, subfamily B [Eubacterium ruminantium]SJZ44039.1 ATP-binding cassette, subfamily B [Eubacterium ruminantium]